MNHPGVYLHWGVIQISLANLVVVGRVADVSTHVRGAGG